MSSSDACDWGGQEQAPPPIIDNQLGETTNDSIKKLKVVLEHKVFHDGDSTSQQQNINETELGNIIDSSFMNKLKESSLPTSNEERPEPAAHSSNHGQNLRTLDSGLDLTELTASTGSDKISTPNNTFHISSGIYVDSFDQVTLKDVLCSTKEDEGETDVIRRLENVPSQQHISKDSLFPNIADSFLDNIDDNDDDDCSDDLKGATYDGRGATVSHRSLFNSDTSNNLSDLTKRLQQLPSYRKYHAASLRTRPNLNDSQSTSRPSTKKGADLYYHNAANIFPTRRRSSKSLHRTELFLGDVESCRDKRTEDGEEYEPSKKKKKRGSKLVRNIRSFGRRRNADLDLFKEFVEPHKKSLWGQIRMVVSYIILPSLIMAVILFYGFDNPPTGLALGPCSNTTDDVEEESTESDESQYQQVPMRLQKISPAPTIAPIAPTVSPTLSHTPTSTPTIYEPWMTLSPTIFPTRKPTYVFSDTKNETICRNEEISLKEASISWWFLFIGVRHVVIFCLAVFLELVIIDFFTFRTRFFPKILGTKLALAVGQSKGWPFLLFFTAMFDAILLLGPRKIARHWLYHQTKIDLMNTINPSGNIPDNIYYRRIIYFSLILSATATIKRTVMANFVGQRVVAYYRSDLSKLIKKLLVVSDVAELSNNTKCHVQDRRTTIFQRLSSVGRMVADRLESEYDFDEDEEDTQMGTHEYTPSSMRKKSLVMKSGGIISSLQLNDSQTSFMTSIYENLDEWEEPELHNEYEDISTTDVLHFRRAVDFINSDYPFSPAFGKATTREECAQSSQNIFNKLLVGRRQVLDFKDICKLAENSDGVNDKKKVSELVRLFRPNRAGEITKVEFIKSIDSVYKRLRLILANINSSSQIDRSYGQIANLIFFLAASLVGLWAIGVEVRTLVLALSGLVVSSAFMIGSAASKYLEGILLILVRRPYDIGDRVCFLDPNAGTDDFGPSSGGWIVEKVDLYTTTVRLGSTREYATFTNGSLSNSRILNLRRSEKPNVYMYLKFTMDATQEQLDEFRRKIIVFIKDRPREWIKVVSLRCTNVEIDLQYLKYVLIVQHRESWQSFSTIQVSKGDIYIYALYLQKELSMDYTAPKMPVQLSGDLANSLTNSLIGGAGNKFSNQNISSETLHSLFRKTPPDDANTFRNPSGHHMLDDMTVNLAGVQPAQSPPNTTSAASVRYSGSQNSARSSERSKVSFVDEQPLDDTKNKVV